MLSNQVLHKTVQDIRRITELEGSVWDLRGTCLVMTNEKQTALYKKVSEFIKIAEETEEYIEVGAGLFLV